MFLGINLKTKEVFSFRGHLANCHLKYSNCLPPEIAHEFVMYNRNEQ